MLSLLLATIQIFCVSAATTPSQDHTCNSREAKAPFPFTLLLVPVIALVKSRYRTQIMISVSVVIFREDSTPWWVQINHSI